MPEDPKKYHFVDALRGMAILGVMMVHASELAHRPASAWLSKIALEATHGVQLFYMASAFTLFLSYHARKSNRAFNISDFYIRRFFRIAPLFYLAMVIYLLLHGLEPRYFAPDGIKWWHILSTATFTNGWHPTSVTSIVPGGWSVAIEMNFYLILPLCFKYVISLNRALWFTLLALVIHILFCQMMDPVLQPLFPKEQKYLIFFFLNILNLPAQLGVFGLGFILYFLFRSVQSSLAHRSDKIKRQKSLIFFIIFFYILTDLLTGNLQLRAYNFFPHHFIFGIAFVIFAYALAIYPSKIFVNPATRKIGEISYSMYLVHPIVLKGIKKLTDAITVPLNQDLLFLITFSSLILFTFFLSSITHKYIEKPGMAMGRRLINQKKITP